MKLVWFLQNRFNLTQVSTQKVLNSPYLLELFNWKQLSKEDYEHVVERKLNIKLLENVKYK